MAGPKPQNRDGVDKLSVLHTYFQDVSARLRTVNHVIGVASIVTIPITVGWIWRNAYHDPEFVKCALSKYFWIALCHAGFFLGPVRLNQIISKFDATKGNGSAVYRQYQIEALLLALIVQASGVFSFTGTAGRHMAGSLSVGYIVGVISMLMRKVSVFLFFPAWPVRLVLNVSWIVFGAAGMLFLNDSWITSFFDLSITLLGLIVSFLLVVIADFYELQLELDNRTYICSLCKTVPHKLLRVMFHEVRVPASSISAGAELLMEELRNEKPDVSMLTSLVDGIRAGVSMLAQIVTNFMDADKFSTLSSDVKMTPDVVVVGAMFSDLEHAFKSTARLMSRTLLFEYTTLEDPCCLRVPLDRSRLVQAVSNLVSNALKFARNKDSVKCIHAHGFLEIYVQDDGLGMDAEALAELRKFRPFFLSERPVPLRNIGTGIGLSVANAIVVMAGGTLSVESEEGVGTTFAIRIKSKYDYTFKVERALASKLDGPPSSPTLARNVVDGTRLLLVEDDPICARLTMAVLTRKGFNVRMVDNGKKAVELLRANPVAFDVVLMDNEMPEMGGIEAVEKIREFAHVSIIGLTANGMEKDLTRFLKSGVNDVMVKPFRFEEFAQMYERVASFAKV